MNPTYFHTTPSAKFAPMFLRFTGVAAACLLALALNGLNPTRAYAAEPSTEHASAVSAPGAKQSAFYRFRVGNVDVVALSDGTVPQDLHALLKGASVTEIDSMLRRAFMANPVEASINAYLIDTGTQRILVDTGAGAFFGAGAGGKLVDSLRGAGYRPEQINDVLLTHVHTDHSGGLVDAAGRMVFSNATIHVGQPDIDFFLAPANQAGVDGYDKSYFEQATKSLTPYVKAGKVRGFKSAGEVAPGVSALPTPGHTPGHAFYVLRSNGQTLEFIGDILHVQSIQMAHPEVTITYDVDQPAAGSQRNRQFTRLADERDMVAGAHLPFPGIGHLRKENAGFTYVPTDYRNRDAQP